ncbi:hypothetical protein [Micromonospora sp. CPCC 206061]|uniref:hypothetical protein n=1 Tax=Micromonospora sp. CPCC 206061 TaxID=3122410 RepID=UPI002FF309AE
MGALTVQERLPGQDTAQSRQTACQPDAAHRSATPPASNGSQQRQPATASPPNHPKTPRKE